MLKNFKKIIVTVPLLMGTLLVANSAYASATSGNFNLAPTNNSELLSSDRISNDDTILRLSDNTYVHGKVTLYNILDLNNSVISLDTDNNALAKKAGDIRNGEAIEPLEATNSHTKGTKPPVQLLNLGTGAYASGKWPVSGGKWYYTDYAYQAVPSAPGKSLYFSAEFDSMLAGDSEDWNNTNNTGVGAGVFIGAGQGTEVIPGIGTALACWSWSPGANSGYLIYNTH